MTAFKNRKALVTAAVFAWIAVFLCMAGIFYLSGQVAEESAQLSGSFLSIIMEYLGARISQNAMRKAAHFSEYAALAGLVFVAAGLTWHRKRPVFAWIIAVLYACTDEVHQMFVPGRACRLFDLAVDAAGAVAGIFFCILVLRISHRLTGRNRKCGEKRLK